MNNEELMTSLQKFAKSSFDAAGVFLPMWVLVDQHDQQYVYMTQFANDAEKDLAEIFIREQVSEKQAVRLAFVSETWYVSMPSGLDLDEARRVVPSQHSERKECIFIAIEDKDGQSLTSMMEIKRGMDGKGTLLDPDTNILSKSKNEGRFANFFEQRVLQ